MGLHRDCDGVAITVILDYIYFVYTHNPFPRSYSILPEGNSGGTLIGSSFLCIGGSCFWDDFDEGCTPNHVYFIVAFQNKKNVAWNSGIYEDFILHECFQNLQTTLFKTNQAPSCFFWSLVSQDGHVATSENRAKRTMKHPGTNIVLPCFPVFFLLTKFFFKAAICRLEHISVRLVLCVHNGRPINSRVFKLHTFTF